LRNARFRKKVSVRDEMAPRSAQRRPRRSSHPVLRHEPRELRGRVRACRARRAQPRSRRASPGRRSRRAPPARKVNCPVSLTRPSHLTPRRAPPRKGRAQFDNPDSSVQNTIYASENARFETQQTITNGGRAKVAGASRLQTREMAPSSLAPARSPARFARNASGLARRDSGNTRGRRPRPRPRLPVSPSPRPRAAPVLNRRPVRVRIRLSGRVSSPKNFHENRLTILSKRRPRRPRRGVALCHRRGCAAAAVRRLPPPAEEQELQVRRGVREGGRRRIRRGEVQVRLRDLASRRRADEGEAAGGRRVVSVARPLI
jgi:hypothetical protein